MKARKLKETVKQARKALDEMNLQDAAEVISRQINNSGKYESIARKSRVYLSMPVDTKMRAFIKEIAMDVGVEVEYLDKGKIIEVKPPEIA